MFEDKGEQKGTVQVNVLTGYDVGVTSHLVGDAAAGSRERGWGG